MRTVELNFYASKNYANSLSQLYVSKVDTSHHFFLKELAEVGDLGGVVEELRNRLEELHTTVGHTLECLIRGRLHRATDSGLDDVDLVTILESIQSGGLDTKVSCKATDHNIRDLVPLQEVVQVSLLELVAKGITKPTVAVNPLQSTLADNLIRRLGLQLVVEFSALGVGNAVSRPQVLLVNNCLVCLVDGVQHLGKRLLVMSRRERHVSSRMPVLSDENLVELHLLPEGVNFRKDSQCVAHCQRATLTKVVLRVDNDEGSLTWLGTEDAHHFNDKACQDSKNHDRNNELDEHTN